MAPGEGTHDPQTGPSQTTAHYQILEQIGQGGMGTVYRARDTKLDIEVALKRLSSEMAESEQGVRRFLNEAKTIAQLNHQNIVRVITIGEDDQGHYIVMDLIDGQDLGRVIQQRGKLDLDEAMDLFRGICNGVSYAHKRGVIHRDIKPSNVLLMSDGTPKLVDFGLARMGRESDLSMTGYGLGTMAYMSPEQRRDAKHVDHRSDIFALAKTFYHMVTGEVPDVVDPEALPENVRPAVMKALKPKPEDRYFSVDEFCSEINSDGISTAPSKLTANPDDRCASCGYVNPQDVRFCQGCGIGLFETCPDIECGHEQRAGIRFCGGCGLNIGEYRQYLDHLETAQRYLETHKYSRAAKEAASGLEVRADDPELTQLKAKAESLQEHHEELLSRLNAALEERRLKTANKVLDELSALAPDDEGAREARVRVDEYRAACQRHESAAKEYLSDRDYAGAVESAKEALVYDREAIDAARMIEDAHQALSDIDDLKREIEAAWSKKNLAKVAELCDRIVAKGAKEDWIEERLEEVELLRTKVNEQLMRARGAAASGRYDEAYQLIAEASTIDPRNESILGFSASVASDLVGRARVAFERMEYAEIDSLLAVAIRFRPGDGRAIELQEELATRKTTIETILEKLEHIDLTADPEAYLELVEELDDLDPDALQDRARVNEAMQEIAERSRGVEDERQHQEPEELQLQENCERGEQAYSRTRRRVMQISTIVVVLAIAIVMASSWNSARQALDRAEALYGRRKDWPTARREAQSLTSSFWVGNDALELLNRIDEGLERERRAQLEIERLKVERQERIERDLQRREEEKRQEAEKRRMEEEEERAKWSWYRPFELKKTVNTFDDLGIGGWMEVDYAPSGNYALVTGSEYKVKAGPVLLECKNAYKQHRRIVDYGTGPEAACLHEASAGRIKVAYATETFLTVWPDYLASATTLEVPVSQVVDLEFTPDGDLLIVACWHSIIVFEVDDMRERYAIPRGANSLTHLSVDPSGRYFAFEAHRGLTRGDSQVIISDLKTGSRIKALIVPGFRATTRFSPDGRKLAVCSKNKVIVYDTSAWSPEKEFAFPGGDAELYDVAFSPDGRVIAGGGSRTGGCVKFWDYDTGKVLQTLKAHGGYVNRILFDQSGSGLVTYSSGTSYNRFRHWKAGG